MKSGETATMPKFDVSQLEVSAQADRATRALCGFYQTPLDQLLGRDPREGLDRHLVALFQDVASTVPAYAQFLAERGVDARDITSVDDFFRLPTTSKAEYHQRYALRELCRHGQLERCDFLAVSSGS